MSHWGNGRDEGREELADSHAGEEVAHVRARFGVDPSTPTRLADAWTAPMGAVEDVEAEFVDAVADCLSVGLPVEAAVASWRSGTLAAEDDKEDDEEDDDEDTSVFVPTPPRRASVPPKAR
jgi:hypothetical protein